MDKGNITVELSLAEVAHVSMALGVALAHWHREKRTLEEFNKIAEIYSGVVQKLTDEVVKKEAQIENG